MPAFDTLIVGADTAGCLLARRLVERLSPSVALLEAGPRHPATILDLPWSGICFSAPWTDVLRSIAYSSFSLRRRPC